MKAVILKEFGSTDQFALANVEQPLMQDDEVLIHIKATAFNPIDCQMRRGDSEAKFLKSPILGRELSGIIIAKGNKVNDFEIGDAVAAYVAGLTATGTYAEYISVPHQMIAKLPGNLSFPQAAALPLVGMTALQCFERLDLSKKKNIFISGGAGGVGTILIQLLLSEGNHTIITTAGNEQSKAHLSALGLPDTNIINYNKANFIDEVKATVQEGLFDYCIDLVGGHMSEVCATVLKTHGTYVDITFLSTEKARELLFDKATSILNVANYTYTLSGNVEEISIYGKKLADLFDRIKANTLVPASVNIVGNLSAETVKEAHEIIETNATRGKKLVMVND